MRFPGHRKSRHYFPVHEKGRIPFNFNYTPEGDIYIVGMDQLLVDIEARVDDQFLIRYGLEKGQSILLADQITEDIYRELKQRHIITGEYAGGSIGNTLHNYSVLADHKAIVLGAMSSNIQLGDYAFKYICNTSFKVDFSYLQPVDGPMGRALCLVTPDGERTFCIAPGRMNDLNPEYVPGPIIEGSSALVLSSYLFRDQSAPLYASAMKAAILAKEAGVPVVLALGTSQIVKEMKVFLIDFIKEYVNVLAMNKQEAYELSGETDPLLASNFSLDLCDLVLLTVGDRGQYLSGYVDEVHARQTKDPILSKTIPEYNKYEYSRAMLLRDCEKPMRIYTHINPFMGGPRKIYNTNGAGDAALSALLHDLTANKYHRMLVPNSPKHSSNFLTYSSLSQMSRYSNRVSFEVLCQNSPRLSRALPEREDSLEDAYWDH